MLSKNIPDEFEKSRVCKMEFSENLRNTFHILREKYSGKTDIFLINLPRNEHMDVESYKVLQSIKDGLGISGNYISAELVFKTSNILIVF